MKTPDPIILELLGPVNFYLGMGIQIVTALFLGGLVGLDRERKMKSAGIKTNILICLGACLYTSVSLLNIPEGSMADPNRIAAQIVSGIGFLGAGAIIQSRGHVIGLTTAATIWVVAAIGLTIGSGYPFVAILFTVTILVVLKLLNPIYNLILLQKDFRTYHVEILSHGRVKNQVKQMILAEVNDINEMSEEVLNTSNDERILNVYITIHPRRMKFLAKELKSVLKVEKINYHTSEYETHEDD
ncbi:MgtC/SapB family protein [Halobacteriovorax sp. HLS]|uniref:MgtC/SapB family protein n=1 Tax=Halobacteriovorax sp. HLS TaxID=2234000 RepID=UPI000FDA2C17|nr:MgtC/SapB family protein [Halobacteriovorax sp. HLS]